MAIFNYLADVLWCLSAKSIIFNLLLQSGFCYAVIMLFVIPDNKFLQYFMPRRQKTVPFSK